MRLLNVGCGAVFDRRWINLDRFPATSAVTCYDAHDPLPFPDREFDACYASHLLEHLAPPAAIRFLGEAARVLRPSAVIRLVVPDLEGIAREYLRQLDALMSGAGDERAYDWILLEVLDQLVRQRSGGSMREFFRRHPGYDYVAERVGREAVAREEGPIPPRLSVLRQRGILHALEASRREATKFVVRLVGGRSAADAMTEGLFRQSGEVHQWMYDRFSLRRALVRAGFESISVCRHNESRISGFNEYGLDSDPAGRPRKPDSLYMEGLRA